MKIRCVWEHNGADTILYSDNFIGAFTRGQSKEIALEKMKKEVELYLRWQNEEIPDSLFTEIIQEEKQRNYLDNTVYEGSYTRKQCIK